MILESTLNAPSRRCSRILFALCLGMANQAVAEIDVESYYDIAYRIDLDQTPATASLVVKNNKGRLRSLEFDANDPRFSNFKGKGKLVRDEERLIWRVPSSGGKLSWNVTLTNKRSSGGYDARRNDDWALFRAEDAFPAMASKALKGAAARATLTIDAPAKWSVQTPFEKQKGVYIIDNPDRFFDRPTGWIITGALGTRVDRVADTRVVVSAPRGQNARRQDVLALSNWVIPELVRVLPDYPARLLIVMAGDPFWRGGLSGPASLFMHTDRPLISENGTSTLAHELFHVGFSRPAAENADWIVEGLAEFYAVELLRRSGTTTAERYSRTLDELRDWAKEAQQLRVARSTGAVTAKAALTFKALNDELLQATNNKQSLDDVVIGLSSADGPLAESELTEIVGQILGRESRVLAALEK